jgi:hypothetical protein
VTAKEGVVVGMRSMPGSPYDGHTLHSQLEQVEILTGVQPAIALADRSYRGVAPPEGTRLLLSHTRGLPPSLKKLLKRRQATEPTIGHMKADGLLARNWLKGGDGDAIHAVLCGAGHNLRLTAGTPAGACLGPDRADTLCRRLGQGGVARDNGSPERLRALASSIALGLNGLFRADYLPDRRAAGASARSAIGRIKRTLVALTASRVQVHLIATLAASNQHDRKLARAALAAIESLRGIPLPQPLIGDPVGRPVRCVALVAPMGHGA